MEHACLVWSLWFHQVCPWCQFLLGPPQCLCPTLSTEVDLSPSGEGDTFHHHPLPAARPGGQNHSDQWVVIRGQEPKPIQRGRPKDGVTWELIWGLGYSGSSLPSWLGLSPANLLYREDFPQSANGVGVTLFQSGVVSSGWRLDGVRIWKLSRTYPGEKPPSLSVLTHRLCLATRKPTRHLLAMPWILVRIGAPDEGRWSTPFHLPRNYGTIFNPRFLIFI